VPLHHLTDAKVTSGGETISQHARVNENGGIVKVYVFDPEALRWRAHGWMRYTERKEVGESVSYFGTPSGERLPVRWNITPNPCRSCR
jgi:hypothetical protein